MLRRWMRLTLGAAMASAIVCGGTVFGAEEGAAVATAAMCGPTCMLAFFVARTWDRFKEARWRMAIQAGMVPLSLGLIAASAFVLARAADHNVHAGLITGATAAVAFFTRINPLWAFLIAGVLGLSGWL